LSTRHFPASASDKFALMPSGSDRVEMIPADEQVRPTIIAAPKNPKCDSKLQNDAEIGRSKKPEKKSIKTNKAKEG